jgi:adenosylhomocysteine nucleosidase
MRLAALLAAFAAPLAAQQPRPLVVQGAMPIEVEKLAARLDGVKPEQVGGWTFWRGAVAGYPVIVSRTMKGIANSAAATMLAVERYRPVAIINQGTSGGHEPSLKPYDIVLGASAVSLGAFKSPFRASGTGSHPLEWQPMDLMASEGTASDPRARRIARFRGDAALLAAARGVRRLYKQGKVVDGVIGSSDVWNDELDLIAHFNREYGTSVEEMETAGVAQIAGILGVPFLGIRIVSDNITNGSAYDPKTGEACQDFVYEVVKAYVATLPR